MLPLRDLIRIVTLKTEGVWLHLQQVLVIGLVWIVALQALALFGR